VTTLRRVSPGALYEPTYKWDGACRCGANEWAWEWWKGGYSLHCCLCGWVECTHIHTGIRHTSDGLWTGGSRKSKPPQGCPCLQNAPTSSSTPSISGASDMEQALPVSALSAHTGENRAESSDHPTASPPKRGGGSFTGAARRPHLSQFGREVVPMHPGRLDPNRIRTSVRFRRPVVVGTLFHPEAAALLSPQDTPHHAPRPAVEIPPLPLRGRPGPSFEVAAI